MTGQFIIEPIKPDVSDKKPYPLSMLGKKLEETPGRSSLFDAQVFPQLPRFSTFSGCMTNTDVSFEEWAFEVKCLVKDGEDIPVYEVKKKDGAKSVTSKPIIAMPLFGKGTSTRCKTKTSSPKTCNI